MGVEYDYSYGVVGDNVTDDTANLQTAINTATTNGNILYITGRSAVSIQTDGAVLTIPSNAHIKFMLGASLHLNAAGPYSAYGYQMLLLDDVTNCTIDYPQLDGAKEMETSAPIENNYGIGISIRGGSGHVINKPVIRDTYGDGIYIAGSTDGSNTPPATIQINQPHVIGAGRNGISVISANGLLIYEPVLENTNYSNPMSGIDFEPNYNTDKLTGIEVINPRCINCLQGIEFAFENLPGSIAQVVGITISGTDQIGSTLSGGTAFAFYNLNKGSYSVSGTITVNSPRYYHCNDTVYYSSSWHTGVITVTFNNPTTIA